MSGNYMCPRCPEIFGSSLALEAHMHKHDGDVCLKCGYVHPGGKCWW